MPVKRKAPKKKSPTVAASEGNATSLPPTQPDDDAKGDQLAKDIGLRIVQAREGLGWSQSVLNVRTGMQDPDRKGISRSVLSLYETGVNKPGAREIRILCETLKVTPNWLIYGTESPAKTIQASFAFLQGNELSISVRLAFAMLALDPEERDSLASLLFALLVRKLGDVQLSSLMDLARSSEDKILAEIIEAVGKEKKELPLRDLLDIFVAKAVTGVYSNYGNLRPAIPENEIDEVDPALPPPQRQLKRS